MMNMWTILTLSAVIPLVVSNITMYDVLKEKCPYLEKTSLKDHDILSKNCVNWDSINETSTLTDENKNYAQCLLLYKTLSSFCTDMKDNNMMGSLISLAETSNTNLTNMCDGNVSLTKLPVKNIEYDYTSLIKNNVDCFLLCVEYTMPMKVSKICQLAYFFATFNINKFTIDQESIHKNGSGIQKLDTKQLQNISDSEIGKKEIKFGSNNITAGNSTKNDVSHTVLDNNNLVSNNSVVQKNEGVINKVIPNMTKEVDEHKIDTDMQIPAVLDNSIKVDTEEEENEIQEKNKNNLPQEVAIEEEKSQADPDIADVNQDDEILEDGDEKEEPPVPIENDGLEIPPKKVKPSTVEDEAANKFNTPEDDMDGDSYFFSYFTVIMCLCIVGYVGYHNRQKVLALILEGKKGRRMTRSRRPNSANYHKLDTNLEEAISSSCTKNTNNVIY